jgi:hypothetical protein
MDTTCWCINGNDGLVGSTGPQGLVEFYTGPQGPSGSQTGPAATYGYVGPTGPTGRERSGFTGPTGSSPTGPTGPPSFIIGPTGPQGRRGVPGIGMPIYVTLSFGAPTGPPGPSPSIPPTNLYTYRYPSLSETGPARIVLATLAEFFGSTNTFAERIALVSGIVRFSFQTSFGGLVIPMNNDNPEYYFTASWGYTTTPTSQIIGATLIIPKTTFTVYGQTVQNKLYSIISTSAFQVVLLYFPTS